MIAALHFDRPLEGSAAAPTLEPGLRRIDEILAVVLARYESVETTEVAAPDEQTAHRFSNPSRLYPHFKEELPCSS